MRNLTDLEIIQLNNIYKVLKEKFKDVPLPKPYTNLMADLKNNHKEYHTE